ncbi:uncharacterized protein [Ptychodera flava]|uniref:uncharacterized protein n=1 Tax=Ptychodera flava TaxID=63121 RepID=UPI00396A260A
MDRATSGEVMHQQIDEPAECGQRNSIFLCSNGSVSCSHCHSGTTANTPEEWFSDEEEEGVFDDPSPDGGDTAGPSTSTNTMDVSTQTLFVHRPCPDRDAMRTHYHGDIRDVCERSWVNMVEEQELLEELGKRGIRQNDSVQNWRGPRMTVLQQIRLTWIGRNYKLPAAIWHHLRTIIQRHPAMLDQHFQVCMERFSRQSEVIMKRALLRLERYRLDRFKNVWDLFHVCVLHAIHEK